MAEKAGAGTQHACVGAGRWGDCGVVRTTQMHCFFRSSGAFSAMHADVIVRALDVYGCAIAHLDGLPRRPRLTQPGSISTRGTRYN